MKKIFTLCFILVFLASAMLLAQKKYDVDVAAVADGSYLGKFRASSYDYNAVVNVAGGKITEIRLLKTPNANVKKKSDSAFKTMVTANSVEADGVSGATWKAVVHDALTKKTPYTGN